MRYCSPLCFYDDLCALRYVYCLFFKLEDQVKGDECSESWEYKFVGVSLTFGNVQRAT